MRREFEVIPYFIQALAKDGCINRDEECLVTGRYKSVPFQQAYQIGKKD